MTAPSGRVPYALIVTLCLVLAGHAGAQTPPDAIDFEALGFTDRRTAGARCDAMPALATSSADAATAAINPACLSRIKRVSVAAAFGVEQSRHTLDYGSGPGGEAVTDSRPTLAGVAFPVPVIRGSLVPAFTVTRIYSSVLDLAYTRYNPVDVRDENYTLQQRGATYEYTFGIALDLAFVLAGGLSLFALDGNIDALVQYDWVDLRTSQLPHTYVRSDRSADVDGYGARLGLALYAIPHVQAGLVVTTPVPMKVSGDVTVETTQYVSNGIGSFERTTESTDTEYTLPYRVDLALAFPVRSLLLATQVGYTNWVEATIDDQQIRTSKLDPVMRSVIDVSAGLEWSPGSLPVRLRIGAMHAPAALKYMQADRIQRDEVEPIQEQSGRTRLSAGLGLILRASVVLDAAYTQTRAERRSASVSEDYRSSYFSIQGSYWF